MKTLVRDWIMSRSLSNYMGMGIVGVVYGFLVHWGDLIESSQTMHPADFVTGLFVISAIQFVVVTGFFYGVFTGLQYLINKVESK